MRVTANKYILSKVNIWSLHVLRRARANLHRKNVEHICTRWHITYDRIPANTGCSDGWKCSGQKAPLSLSGWGDYMRYKLSPLVCSLERTLSHTIAKSTTSTTHKWNQWPKLIFISLLSRVHLGCEHHQTASASHENYEWLGREKSYWHNMRFDVMSR